MRRGGRASPEIDRRAEPTTPSAVSTKLPDPKWNIQRLLEYKELPPHAEPGAIVTAPTLSTRNPTESDYLIPRIPVPSDKSWLVELRNRVKTGAANGRRSIHSPYGGDGRLPLWTAHFWTEVEIFHRKRAAYAEAKGWLQRNQSTIANNLTVRVFADWRQFPWSKLNEKLKSPKTEHLPEPDELLKLLSDDWIEDPLMEIMITLLSMEIERRKITNVTVVPLQFWRELEHLQANDASFNELHYPALAEALKLVHQKKEIAFIISDQNQKNRMGSHWTACVLNVDRREYRFGDSFGRDPPPYLQPRLEIWLHWCNELDSTQTLRRADDLDHNTQRDANSCGFIAINMLEHYILPRTTKLWTPESNASLRVTKYINLMEYNGSDRGSPITSQPPSSTPIRPRTSSGASSINSRSTGGSRSTRASSRAQEDPMLGDIPFEGDDANHLRGWTPGEGTAYGSRYAAVPPPRSDGSRSRSGSRASSFSREGPDGIPLPDLTNRGIPIFKNGVRPKQNGSAQPNLSPTSQPNLSPPQKRLSAQAIQRSRPVGAKPPPSQPGTWDQPLIPASEWSNPAPPSPLSVPVEERGRRPRPITPPSPTSSGTGIIPSGVITETDDGSDNLKNVQSGALTPWAKPTGTEPLTPANSRPSPPSQQIPFPTTVSKVSPKLRTPHKRSKSEFLQAATPPPTKPQLRERRGSGSSLTSLWRSVRGKIGGGSPAPPAKNSRLAPPVTSQSLSALVSGSESAVSDRSPQTRPRTLSQSSAVSSEAFTSGTEDRGRSEFAGSVRSRKSSMKSQERGPGETRLPGLSVQFNTDEPSASRGRAPRNLASVDAKREGDEIRKNRTPPSTPILLRGKKRSAYPAREAMATPPHFNLNDPSWPPNRQQEAIEQRHDVVIDTEPTRLIVHGTRSGVKNAVRELYGVFREFQEGNMTESFVVSRRAAHRIGLWAICQRLQKETGVRIIVQAESSTIIFTGPKTNLGTAYHTIKAFASEVDDEKHTHYLVPSSKDLRRMLMIELPRLIATGGGPEDEEEARQMFTISNPSESQGFEMVVDLWCHPNLSPTLTAGLRRIVEEYSQYRAREVWGMRVSPWKLHALKNSHIFRRWDDPANSPEGSEIVPLHTLEKRLHVNILFPDEPTRPTWDTMPVRNLGGVPKESLVKIRGAQAQLTATIAELEDRVRRLQQVAVRVPATFHKDLRSSRVARRLADIGLDADIKDPGEQFFECTLSAVRQQDLVAGQAEISRMASRIAKGLPPIEHDPRDRERSRENVRDQRPDPRDRKQPALPPS